MPTLSELKNQGISFDKTQEQDQQTTFRLSELNIDQTREQQPLPVSQTAVDDRNRSRLKSSLQKSAAFIRDPALISNSLLLSLIKGDSSILDRAFEIEKQRTESIVRPVKKAFGKVREVEDLVIDSIGETILDESALLSDTNEGNNMTKVLFAASPLVTLNMATLSQSGIIDKFVPESTAKKIKRETSLKLLDELEVYRPSNLLLGYSLAKTVPQLFNVVKSLNPNRAPKELRKMVREGKREIKRIRKSDAKLSKSQLEDLKTREPQKLVVNNKGQPEFFSEHAVDRTLKFRTGFNDDLNTRYNGKVILDQFNDNQVTFNKTREELQNQFNRRGLSNKVVFPEGGRTPTARFLNQIDDDINGLVQRGAGPRDADIYKQTLDETIDFRLNQEFPTFDPKTLNRTKKAIRRALKEDIEDAIPDEQMRKLYQNENRIYSQGKEIQGDFIRETQGKTSFATREKTESYLKSTKNSASRLQNLERMEDFYKENLNPQYDVKEGLARELKDHFLMEKAYNPSAIKKLKRLMQNLLVRIGVSKGTGLGR